MHLYPKQSRYFRPGLTSTSKPATPFSQALLTYGKENVVKRESGNNNLKQASHMSHQNGSAMAQRLTFTPTPYLESNSSSKPLYSHSNSKEEPPTYNECIKAKTPLSPEEILILRPSYPKTFWSNLVTITSTIGYILLLKQRILYLYALTSTTSNPPEFPENYLWGSYGELWYLALATIPGFIRMVYLGILDHQEEQKLRKIRDAHVSKQANVSSDLEKCEDSMWLRVFAENGALIKEFEERDWYSRDECARQWWRSYCIVCLLHCISGGLITWL